MIEEIEAGEAGQEEKDAILYHDINNCANKAICGMQSGAICLVDIEAGQTVAQGPGVHEYQVWYTSYSSHAERSGDIVYSASDDASFKKFDTRVGLTDPVYTNKRHHQAGVTFVRSMDLMGCASPYPPPHCLVTGSYDCTVAQWDERQMGREPVHTISTGGKSVWDIKVHPEAKHWGIASIYDGYLFDINGQSRNESHDINQLDFSAEQAQYTGHESICYSFAWTEQSTTAEPIMLTSSFYDNTL